MIQVKEKYIVDDKGKPTNVILTKKDYDRIVEYIEELEDVAAYDKAKHPKGNPTPWEKINNTIDSLAGNPRPAIKTTNSCHEGLQQASALLFKIKKLVS